MTREVLRGPEEDLGASETPAEVASYLGYLLRRFRKQAARLAAEEAEAEEGAGECQAHELRELAVLSLLQECGPKSQQELADRLRINRSTMVKLIDHLEARGEVRRVRDSSDRRRYALELADEGVARARELRRRADLVGRALTRSLSVPERARLSRLLAELARGRGLDDPPSPLSGCLLWSATMLQQELESFGDSWLAPLGLDVRRYVSLVILSGLRCSQSELGNQLLIGPASTVELVDELERLGAVERRRSAADRRVHELRLTGRGRRLLEDAHSLVSAASEEFFGGLTADAYEELTELMQRAVGLGHGTRRPQRRRREAGPGLQAVRDQP